MGTEDQSDRIDPAAPEPAAPAEPAPPAEPAAPAPVVPWTPPSLPGPPGPPPAATFGPAGVLARLVAYLVDSIVIYLVGVLVVLIFGLVIPGFTDDPITSRAIAAIILATVAFVYLVGMWTSRGRATIGMRMFRMRVVSSATGRTLPIGDALNRWVLMGYPALILSAIPIIANQVGIILIVWLLILLLSTLLASDRRGLHDRWSDSAVERQIGAGNGAVIGCLILVIVLVVLAPIGLFFLGSQVQDVLDASAFGPPFPTA